MNRIIEDQQDLASWARRQKSFLYMAVAFWGKDAIEELGIRREQNFRILLDLTSGCTNPYVVRALRKISIDNVRHVPRLHSKLYVGKSEIVIGSANASANGLGAEGSEASHWKELSLLTNDIGARADALTWFEKQWADSRPILAADLAKAEDAWRKRRRERPSGKNNMLLEVARDRPQELADRRIYINVVTERMDRADIAEIKRLEKENSIKLHGFTYFSDIPIDATMINFTEYDGQQLARDVPFICHTPVEKKRSKFKFVTPSTLGGYELGDVNELRKRIRFYRDKNPRRWVANNGMCEEVTKFVEETNAAVTL